MTDVDGFLSCSMLPKQEHPHEGTHLGSTVCGLRACVSAFHPDTGTLARVFNASENLGTLHRLENRPKGTQSLVNLGWNSIMSTCTLFR